MSYEDVVSEIEKRHRFGKSSGFEVMRGLLPRYDFPEKNKKIIHIAGTNGKGSTAVFLDCALREMGYRTGRFTSPHIVDFTERITVDGKPITHDEVVSYGEKILADEASKDATMFDLCLLMALLYFRDKDCDYIILETGLGGRLDSTNGISEDPAVSVITNIGHDHLKQLGAAVEEIAREKAGIIRAGGHVVLGIMDSTAEREIRNICREINAEVVDLNGPTHAEFFETVHKMKLGLPGFYQKMNAAAALATIRVLFGEDGFSPDDVERGFSKAHFPGRMEILSENPTIIADGAHNPEAVEMFCESLKDLYDDEKYLILCGVLADKDLKPMLEELIPIGEAFYTVTPSSERALPGVKLAEEIRHLNGNAVSFHDISSALSEARKHAISHGFKIVAVGSLYFIGDLKAYLATETE